jgi:hypothetical protein
MNDAKVAIRMQLQNMSFMHANPEPNDYHWPKNNLVFRKIIRFARTDLNGDTV